MHKNDVYKIWNGKRIVLTLNKLAAISEGLMTVPEVFSHIADMPIDCLCNYRLKVNSSEGLTVWILPWFSNAPYEKYVSAAKNGVVVIAHKELIDEDGNELPMIRLPYESVKELVVRLGTYIKKVAPVPTIAITGSVGKTTATLFLKTLFEQKNRVFVSGDNLNISSAIVERMVEDYSPNYDYHIQEAGGGAPRVVEESAKLLAPDAFALLNIYPQHLDKYKTLDGILQDKCSLDRYAKDNAFGVINIDDDLLRKHKFEHRIVTCGITHKEADYVAENIHQDGIWLKMDIVHNGTSVPIKINIPGKHNAYNAVIAFAMAKEWGLSDKEIQNGFLAYKSTGARQNLCEIAGRIAYIDCFNCSAESIHSALHALDIIEQKKGGRKIAVIGAVGAAGEKAFSLNYETGLKLGYSNADELIFRGLPVNTPIEELDKKGGHVHAVYEGALKAVRDRPVIYFDNLDDLTNRLVKETKPGDIILLKGNSKLQLPAALDRAFGSSFFIHEKTSTSELWRANPYVTRYYPALRGSNIINCTNITENITIPNTVVEKPIFRIGKKVFADNKTIKSVDFGLSVQNIGTQSFEGCTGLKKLDIPANVIYVENRAFADCTNLEEVNFAGVLHIENDAFCNCKKLKTVRFTDSCQTIEQNAFAGCRHVVIVAPQGSVAQRYAENNGIAFKCEI